MLIQRASDIPSSEITPENLYHNRREFIKTASAVLGIAAAGSITSAEPQAKKLGPYDTAEKLTPYEDITHYNNYYEFGIDKSDPERNSKKFQTNPLALFATGLYGKPLPNQNGAPLRLVTPWKYGFKGIKAIVNIRFTDKQPLNTWQQQAANEYGFYANVNPKVDHPRWSQAQER